MYPLTKITGPECPRCGCCHGETIGSSTQTEFEHGDTQLERPLRETTILRRQCEHCGKRFTAAAETTNGQHPGASVIDFPILRCPHCDSSDNYVSSSPSRKSTGTKYRHHKCRACGKNFTSREKRR